MKLTAFVAGMGVGAVVTLLFAPRSGDETQELISQKVDQGRRYAEDRVQDVKDTAVTLAEQGREVVDQGKDAINKGKEVVRRQAKAVAAGAQAGVDTYNKESQPDIGKA